MFSLDSAFPIFIAARSTCMVQTWGIVFRLCVFRLAACVGQRMACFSKQQNTCWRKNQVCSIAQLLVSWPKLKSHEDKSLYLMFAQPEVIPLQSWASVKNSCAVQSVWVRQDCIWTRHYFTCLLADWTNEQNQPCHFLFTVLFTFTYIYTASLNVIPAINKLRLHQRRTKFKNLNFKWTSFFFLTNKFELWKKPGEKEDQDWLQRLWVQIQSRCLACIWKSFFGKSILTVWRNEWVLCWCSVWCESGCLTACIWFRRNLPLQKLEGGKKKQSCCLKGANGTRWLHSAGDRRKEGRGRRESGERRRKRRRGKKKRKLHP